MTNSKDLLRKKLLFLRNNISFTRKKKASSIALQKLKKLKYNKILSFASFGSEIDLWSLNNFLANQNRLCLTRVEKQELHVFEITNIDQDLITSKFGMLEPDPSLCRKIDPNIIDCILVPGIAFDKENHRLGYGKGYYDFFLKNHLTHSIGIGFTEQLVEKLPRTKNDIMLNELILF